MPLYQASNVTPSDITGTGSVDITGGMTITCQINGTSDTPMVGYIIEFYKNDTESTLLWDTGTILLDAPFYGTDRMGNPVYFSVTFPYSTLSSHGIVTGRQEYKYIFMPVFMSVDGPLDVPTYTYQIFRAYNAPVVSISNIGTAATSPRFIFKGAYSQAQNESARWVQWQLRDSDGNMLKDTGALYGVGPLEMEYDGLVSGNTYQVRMSGITTGGMVFDTGWTNYTASYASTIVQQNVTACADCATDSVLVTATLTGIASTARLAVYRKGAGDSHYTPCSDLNKSATPLAMRDYSARNGESYTYYVFTINANGVAQRNVYSSGAVTPQFWDYTLMLCSEDANGVYHMEAEYRFALDVSTGSGSNNNRPTLQANFTPYPLRQPSTQNYRSGTLTAYVGRAVNGQYVDSLSEIDALRQVSTSTLHKFLKTRKGELMMVDTADAISMTIGDKYAQQPVRAAIPWAEVGSAEDAAIVSMPGDAFWQN